MKDDKRIKAIDVTPRDSDAVEISLYAAREKYTRNPLMVASNEFESLLSGPPWGCI